MTEQELINNINQIIEQLLLLGLSFPNTFRLEYLINNTEPLISWINKQDTLTLEQKNYFLNLIEG